MAQIIETDFATYTIMKGNILLLKLKAVDPNKQQVIAHNRVMQEVLKKFTNKFVTVIDVSNIVWVNSEARIMLAQFAKRDEEIYFGKYIHTYFVMQKVALRTLLKGFNFILKPKIPQTICPTLDVALHKATETLLKEQLLTH